MNAFLRAVTQGCAALSLIAGLFLLLAVVMGTADTVFQETVLTTGAGALFALAILMMVMVGVTYLEDSAKLLKSLDERDRKFKEWQVQQMRPHDVIGQQHPTKGQLDR